MGRTVLGDSGIGILEAGGRNRIPVRIGQGQGHVIFRPCRSCRYRAELVMGGTDGHRAICADGCCRIGAILEVDTFGQFYCGSSSPIGLHCQIVHIHRIGMVSIGFCIGQSRIGALGQKGTGRLQLLNINRICISRTCRHIMDLLIGCIDTAAGEFRTVGNREACGIQGSLYGTAGISYRYLSIGPIQLDGFLIAVPAAGTQGSGVQFFQVTGQFYGKAVVGAVGNNSDVVVRKLGGIHSDRSFAVNGCRSNPGPADDAQGLAGSPFHHLSVPVSRITNNGIIPAEPELPSEGIELGAINCISAGSTHQTGGHVLDPAFGTNSTYRDNAGRTAAGIAIAGPIIIGSIRAERLQAGRGTAFFHGCQIGGIPCRRFGLGLGRCFFRIRHACGIQRIHGCLFCIR